MENDLATQNEPVEEVSIEDTVRAQLEQIQARDGNPEPEDALGAAKPAKTTKERAPDGKFAKTPAPATEISAEHTPSDDGTNPAPDAIEQPANTATTAAPSSWKGTAKAKFAALDPEIQSEVLRREADFHKGTEQYKQAANYGQSIHKAIAPFEQTIRQLGVTPDVAIHALFTADHRLRNGSPNDKMQAFAQLAQSYGIDLSQGLPQQQQIDPNTQYLQQRLQQAEQQINQFSTYQQQREQSELNSQIESAKVGKEHFDEVRPHMAALLQAGLAKDLNDAYDQAVGARPDLRQSLFAQQQEAIRAEQVRKAQAAKQAAAVNVNTRGTLRTQAPLGSMEDTIRAQLAAIQAR